MGSDVGTSGGYIEVAGAGDELLDATAGVGVDVDELNGHALAGVNAADHAAHDHRLARAEGEAQLDGVAELEGMRIEQEKAAGREVADARNGREKLDVDGFADGARLQPAVAFPAGHKRKV